jgi:fimbrial chaperone protein
MMTRPAAAMPAVATMLALAAAQAAAGTFSVAPVRVEFDGTHRTAVLTVRNEDAVPLVLQTTTLAWSQEAGEDATEPTRAILATPPVATVAPNGEQIVRIALRGEPDPKRELSYRVLLAEVPQPAQRKAGELQVALRLSLPVFVQAPANAQPQVEWAGVRKPDGSLALQATNHGNMHAQIIDFEVRSGAGAPPQNVATGRYVLPGSTVTWTLPPEQAAKLAARVQLHGQTDQGAFDTEVSIRPR